MQASRWHLSMFFALSLATLTWAATPAEIERWRSEFPKIDPSEPASARELAAGYEWYVRQATIQNLPRTTGVLHDKLDKDLATVGEALRSTSAQSKATRGMHAEAEAKMRWLRRFEGYLQRVK